MMVKPVTVGFREFPLAQVGLLSLLLLAVAGCQGPDPAHKFIARVDQGPAEKRPKDWENTKALMSRPVPAVGTLAPDFTLQTLDGKQTLTRSTYQAGRPMVLIFGSFT